MDDMVVIVDVCCSALLHSTEEKITANWINREIVEMQLKRQMFALRGSLSLSLVDKSVRIILIKCNPHVCQLYAHTLVTSSNHRQQMPQHLKFNLII